MTNYVQNIQTSKLTMYHLIPPTDDSLFIPNVILERLLCSRLKNMSLEKISFLRRIKVVKSEICKALGYPKPSSFKRTHPCFPGQSFAVYIQQGMNLQVSDEDRAKPKRYVFIRMNEKCVISDVKVVASEQLSALASV